MSNFYKFMQVVGGDEAWKLILADQEGEIVRAKQPAFTTILACDNNWQGEMTAEDIVNVAYKGDFYVDFDAASLDEGTSQFQKFLRNLKNEHDVELSQLSLYASGSKGYHCIIPVACFVPKPNPRGYKFLPAIYREMAMSLFVDTLDISIYTAKRGRMFRTANVERPDKPGVYKVPLTTEEVFMMDTDLYRKLCSSPRPEVKPEKAELNAGLSLLWSSAVDKVDAAVKNRKKSKVDVEMLRKHGGEFPPSIAKVMRGEAIREGVGFQKLATQLAIAAHALAKSEEAFLESCEGLCENHKSDGSRYNTPAKRRNELKRMYVYMKDNPCYEYSNGGIRAMLEEGTETSDLDAGADQGEVLDTSGTDEDGSELPPTSLRISNTGLRRRNEEGKWVMLSPLGFSEPQILIDVTSKEKIGYDVLCWLDGKKIGRRLITMDTFISRTKMLQFALATAGTNFNITDSHAGEIAELFRRAAMKSNDMTYTTPREGVDVILNEGRVDVVWIDSKRTVMRSDAEPVNYKLRTPWTKDLKGDYNTDLFDAPDLEDTEEAREFFNNLFNINSKKNTAKLIGFFSACHFTQLIRYKFNQFPYLQLTGQAGAGKSASAKLFSRMHYFAHKEKMIESSSQRKFGFEVALSTSGSLPLFIEEFKPREMKVDQINMIRNAIRNNYTGTVEMGRGGPNSDTGQTNWGLSKPTNSAPLVTLGETIEAQTAILDRAVLVDITKISRQGKDDSFLHCVTNSKYLSSFGRLVALEAVNVDLDALSETVIAELNQVKLALGHEAYGNDRPVFNVAVVLTGLEYAKRTLNRVFGNTFDAQIDELKSSLLAEGSAIIPRNVPELVKFLNILAELTTIQDENVPYRLVQGVDYLVASADGEVHIAAQSCYSKYVKYMTASREQLFYPDFAAVWQAMKQFEALVDDNPIDSMLKTTVTQKVAAFSQKKLIDAGVDIFKE